MSSKRYLDLNNPKDLEIAHKILFNDGEEELNHEELDETEDEEDSLERCELPSDTENNFSDSESEGDDFNSEGNNFIGRDKSTVWAKSMGRKNVKRRAHNIITKLPGVIGAAKNVRTIYDSWNCFFTDEILDIIVTNTNRYISTIRRNFSRERDARDTDRIEIKAVIGLLYLAGLLRSNRQILEELWSTEGMGVEMFRTVMSLKRFKFLLRCFRFDNKETRDERKKLDKLAPVREIFDLFVENCKKNYCMGQNVTIDEKLEGFRGKCPFRQYIPSKPNKYGIKIFAMVDAKVLYTLNLEIYAGKQPEGPYNVSNAASDVVLRLARPIFNSGRNITADNWFTSIELIKKLKEKKLSYVGTLRKNKKEIPPCFVQTKERKVYSSLFGFSEACTLVSYIPKKTKNVLLASSMHMDDSIDCETGEERKPEIITFYNDTKFGVDALDKMCGTYNCARNTRRWPMVIFYSMLNISAINGLVVFLGNQNFIKNRREYLRDLVKELTDEEITRRLTKTNLSRDLQRKLENYKPSPEHKNAVKSPNITNKRKRCITCYGVKKSRMTQYSCTKCNEYFCLEHAVMICKKCSEEEPQVAYDSDE